MGDRVQKSTKRKGTFEGGQQAGLLCQHLEGDNRSTKVLEATARYTTVAIATRCLKFCRTPC